MILFRNSNGIKINLIIDILLIVFINRGKTKNKGNNYLNIYFFHM